LVFKRAIPPYLKKQAAKSMAGKNGETNDVYNELQSPYFHKRNIDSHGQ